VIFCVVTGHRARTLGGGDQAEALAQRLAESWQELNRYTARLARAAAPEDTSGPAEVTKSGPATEPAAASPPSPLSLPSPALPSPAAWRWQSGGRWLAGAGLSALALVLAITGARLGSRGGAEWLTGSVTCLSGRPVVGVWIAAASGQDDSGFAHLGPRPGIRAGAASGPAVTYSYRLPQSGPYVVHVGCGGTARDWASRSFSEQLSASTARLRCGDHSPDAARDGSAPDGKCSALRVRYAVATQALTAPGRSWPAGQTCARTPPV
jgi:hypothetical protein